ncbi:EcoAI/FtnUII family type I restriction enzme subunit R [Enterococcus casseliflavus]|uniref:EcoAI/FtnUII family type I restriction enzme subunit R n=1 Tax=Enterococcus sp. DIV2459a TaxID=2774809 RepID=UPI002ED0001F
MSRLKKDMNETEIRTNFITPAIVNAGWDKLQQIREEFRITDGRIITRGKVVTRANPKFADYVLNHISNIPLAVVEAKDNKHTIAAGLQQGMGYARQLDIPFVYSSNGDGFVEYDFFTGKERELRMQNFPSPEALWQRYSVGKGFANNPEKEELITEKYHYVKGDKTPRYYQRIAINRTIEAIANGKKRMLVVMATGTGKTYTAFQIIWRAWKAGKIKKVLYLADRNILIDQTMANDFGPLADVMTKIEKRNLDSSFEIYMSLYQQLSGEDGIEAFKQFSPDFFDLIIVDEAHRGSAREESNWRKILTYFDSAIHLGMTATPKKDDNVDTFDYFGNPLYTYSLKQGIDDGFLAPYKIVRVSMDKDVEGYRPVKGETDIHGLEIKDGIYTGKDFDRNMVIEDRTKTVAKRVTEYLKKNDRMAKTIIFCVDIEHAERMRKELVALNEDMMQKDSRYIMKMTGDDIEGLAQLDNFIDVNSPYPTIVTTSKLLTTGVDAKTVQLIVLDANIASVTEFKQIIGRGTRLRTDVGKYYFTIMDFRNATNLFADPNFDGPAESVIDVTDGEEMPSDDHDMGNEGGIGDDEEVLTNGEDGDTDNKEKPGDVPPAPAGGGEGHIKYYVNHVPVRVLNETVYYYDKDGKIVAEGMREYNEKAIRAEFSTMDDFIKRWSEEERKDVIIEELLDKGVLIEELEEEFGSEYDAFDLILHVAYGQKMMTRSERAQRAKQSEKLASYSGVAREVIDALVQKYQDTGYADFDDIHVLKLDPLNQFGNPMSIAQSFGGKASFIETMKELEDSLYA